jgi:hypothetical protein
MSTKDNEDKGQKKIIQSDEHFINALYDELGKENHNLVDLKPSQTLDESVIAAAHRALSTSTKLVDIKAKQKAFKLQERKRTPIWRVPFGLAASTILVMILFLNQGNEMIVPEIRTAYEPMLTELESDTFFEMTSDISVVESDAVGTKISTQSLKRKQVIDSAAVNSVARSKSHVKKENSQRLTPSVPMRQARPVKDIKVNKEGWNMRSASGSHIKLAQVPWLASSQYLLFKQQKLQWSLVVEKKDHYVILIILSAEKSEKYRISKAKYLITGLADAQITKLAFEKIKKLKN